MQYNESFYDFMVRTANRCGEFFYFENGQLTLGLPKNEAEKLDTYTNVTMQGYTDGPNTIFPSPAMNTSSPLTTTSTPIWIGIWHSVKARPLFVSKQKLSARLFCRCSFDCYIDSIGEFPVNRLHGDDSLARRYGGHCT